MYISKYNLNIGNPKVKQALNDVDKMHRLVWGLFEDTSDFCVSREGLGILYRVITCKDKTFLVIQSNMKPNLTMQSAVGEQIYCVTDEVMENKLRMLGQVNFNILVNPTCYIDEKRKYISKVSDRYAWMRKQAEKNGFEIIQMDEVASEFWKGQKGSHLISFGVSEYKGTLKIIDFDKFYACVKKGIGKEKAYGLGLFQFGV